MRKLRELSFTHCFSNEPHVLLRNVLVPGMTSVSNDAILQLDLAGMEE
jgi:hypothetical protein